MQSTSTQLMIDFLLFQTPKRHKQRTFFYPSSEWVGGCGSIFPTSLSSSQLQTSQEILAFHFHTACVPHSAVTVWQLLYILFKCTHRQPATYVSNHQITHSHSYTLSAEQCQQPDSSPHHHPPASTGKPPPWTERYGRTHRGTGNWLLWDVH